MIKHSVVAVMGTFDTKGQEIEFLIKAIEKAGAKVLTIDAGVFEPQSIEPDISREEVSRVAGIELADILKKNDRGYALKHMINGAKVVLAKLYEEGKINAVISLGGGTGTAIGTGAMKKLPIGFPKMMVSTVASGNTREYVEDMDIIMMNSVVDIAGINRITSSILTTAANAIAGMAMGPVFDSSEGKPIIVASMFGVTTPCVTAAKKYLDAAGFEVLVFPAHGIGGMAMESLIRSGIVSGVLDVTTTEWCDELVGGVLSAGPKRLDAAAQCAIPQVVSVGALDMVNFGTLASVPDKFKNRNLYEHNTAYSLMRTTKEESTKLGEIISEKLSKCTAPCSLFLPLRGVSMFDAPGMHFFGPEENEALFEALRNGCDRSKVNIVEKDMHINDEQFALAMAMELERMIKNA